MSAMVKVNGSIGLSVVVPCYNEAAVLPLLKERLVKCLNELALSWEVIFVDDGSSDSTYKQLASLRDEDSRFRVVRLSRNFGHQVAVCAGLAYSFGDVVAVIDADLQDPPELFAACLKKLSDGYDIVYLVRRKRKEMFLKRFTYALFYRLLKSVADVNIPLDSGDFCLLKRQVVDVLTQMQERHMFVRGMRAWCGFRQFGMEYERSARAAGVTKYPFRKLVQLAADGIFSFSTRPLRIATYLGLCTLAVTFVAGLFLFAWRLLGFRFMGHVARELPGWTAIICGVLFLNGVQLLILGVIGEYIGRIYGEVKQRPRWVVRE